MTRLKARKKYDELRNNISIPDKYVLGKDTKSSRLSPDTVRKKYKTDIENAKKAEKNADSKQSYNKTIGSEVGTRLNLSSTKKNPNDPDGTTTQSTHSVEGNKEKKSFGGKVADLGVTNQKNVRYYVDQDFADKVNRGGPKGVLAANRGKLIRRNEREMSGVPVRFNPRSNQPGSYTDYSNRPVRSSTGTTSFPQEYIDKNKTGKPERKARGVVLARGNIEYYGTDGKNKERSKFSSKPAMGSFYNKDSPSYSDYRTGLAKKQNEIRKRYKKSGRKDYSTSTDVQKIKKLGKDLKQNTIQSKNTERIVNVNDKNPLLTRLKLKSQLKEMISTLIARDLVYLKEAELDSKDERNETLKMTPEQEANYQRRLIANPLRNRKIKGMKK